MKRLKGIKTIDDLLTCDDIRGIVQRLIKEQSKLDGLVVIAAKPGNDDNFYIMSSWDTNSTLGILFRACFTYALKDYFNMKDEE